MKISRRSWHYRAYKGFRYREPTELCSYFWTVAFILAIKTVMVVGISLIAIIVGTFATVVAYQNAGSIFMWLGIIASVFMLGYLARRSWKADHPNIAVAYLRAKKDRLCPLIEVED